jgi:hypothetical protein
MIASATVDRRHVGIAVALLVHALLILGWQATRRSRPSRRMRGA